MWTDHNEACKLCWVDEFTIERGQILNSHPTTHVRVSSVPSPGRRLGPGSR